MMGILFLQEIILMCLSVLLPLVPSVLLYQKFGQMNLSKYEGLNKSIKLGGPIAAYFIIMMVLFNFGEKVSLDSINELHRQREVMHQYVGEWYVATVFKPAPDVPAIVRHAQAHIKIVDNRLALSGVYIDRSGIIENAWEAQDIAFTSKRVVFVWTTNSGVDGTPSMGVAILISDLDGTEETKGMRGTWAVIGKPFAGTMMWSRNEEDLPGATINQ